MKNHVLRVERYGDFMNDAVLRMIGMAKRANKVSSGEFLCSKAIKGGQSRLIILSNDASENTQKTITDSCVYYNIKLIKYGTMDKLGKMTGSGERAVVSVNDDNFAKAILDRFNKSRL